MCESMMQVCARVIGNDQTMAFAGAAGGNFELNIMMPVMGETALESCHLLAGATRAFVDLAAIGMEANAEACGDSIEGSLAMVTSLNPHIGYEKAAALAKEAFKTGKTIRQLCREQKILDEKVLNEALDPRRMTEPH
jgi:fumarate hydratase class II